MTFSTILPKSGPSFLPGINLINERVTSSGKNGPSRHQFSSLCHRENFSDKFGLVNPSLFKSNQLHLSLDGKLAFNLDLNFSLAITNGGWNYFVLIYFWS